MSRCQSCNKFAALNFEEPEFTTEPEYDAGTVTGEVRIYRTLECCGDEAKEASLEINVEVPGDALKGHVAEDGSDATGHEIGVEWDDPEQVEEGGGRYRKSYFGASVNLRLRCSCQPEGADPLWESTWTDKTAASAMDDL